ncbi:Cyclin, N-terminal domain-containing protein [Mycena galericulata]|nr:Cyclin, N-terminal domain-containing protein [Mycena galericulata]
MDEDDWMYMHDPTVDRIKMRDFMDLQPEIRWFMRSRLADYLFEIHQMFPLRRETLYLTLDVVDRYVSRRIVHNIRDYQLLGCTALWIASKFYERTTNVPRLEELTYICRETHSESAFIRMELHILTTVQWVLGHPTAETWLGRVCGDPLKEDLNVQHVARFLMDFTLFYRAISLSTPHRPSPLAPSPLLGSFAESRGALRKKKKQEYFGVVDNLDRLLAAPTKNISKKLVKEYSHDRSFKAAELVLTYYAQGGSYVRSDA